MKPFKQLFMLFCLTALVMSCNDDDDNPPEPVNEEEVITTLTATLTPDGGGAEIELTTRDLDGDGPNPPVVTVSGPLAANSTYNGVLKVENETEDPAEDITEEVKEEAEEHQFLFVIDSALNLTIDYTDQESDYAPNTGTNPVGVTFTVTTTDAGSGTLQILLRHEPKKPNDGTPADAGGETDIEATFNIAVN
ncbi:type 1 periplasmic binding fold superfamily protein [Spongiivirga citrea]|uniref:Type 1 periplasmic binding fold superfamily protein n=1 Tax=Spongiivirga citrea TaxID=1481457 RepID=A0A6M0CSG9_9FLAO|nr:type 1 periplasmic binding fold superfamily protein [Spongiivirga citrea]NER19034.1 type 1 periplasmic binding fold superfamily protein [Spongiivirga citrea]